MITIYLIVTPNRYPLTATTAQTARHAVRLAEKLLEDDWTTLQEAGFRLATGRLAVVHVLNKIEFDQLAK